MVKIISINILKFSLKTLILYLQVTFDAKRATTILGSRALKIMFGNALPWLVGEIILKNIAFT